MTGGPMDNQSLSMGGTNRTDQNHTMQSQVDKVPYIRGEVRKWKFNLFFYRKLFYAGIAVLF